VYGNAINNIVAEVLDIGLRALDGTAQFVADWSLQSEDGKVAKFSATSADPAISGGEATDAEGQDGDTAAGVCVCVKVIDVMLSGIVEDVGLGVGDVVPELPVTRRRLAGVGIRCGKHSAELLT
jgi:hypothetical protein